VSVDVTRAFDNVDIPLLLSLVAPLLQHEQYIVLKYSEVGWGPGRAVRVTNCCVGLQFAGLPAGAWSHVQNAPLTGMGLPSCTAYKEARLCDTFSTPRSLFD